MKVRARRGLVAAAAAMLLCCCLGGSPASAEASFGFDRIGGVDRFDTSALVGQAFGDTAGVILANGQDGHYADALAASYLAGSLQAPILLTKQRSVPDPVAERLTQSGVQHVWVVGGPAAVSDQEVQQLRDQGYDVTRVAGRNRYLTDAAVIEAAGSSQGLGLVATGTDFADALAGSPLAYRGLPLGLADEDSISGSVIDALTEAGVNRVLVIGGTAAVGPDVLSALEAQGISVVDRLDGGAGTGRAATSVAVAEYALAHLGFTDQAVNVASGYADGYGADALAGGALTGSQHRPLLITTDVDDPSAEVLDYLKRHAGTLRTGIVFGGTGAITSNAQAELTAAATTAPSMPSGPSTPPPPPPPTMDPLLSDLAVAYTNTEPPNTDVWLIAFDHGLAPGFTDAEGRLADGVSLTLEDAKGTQIVLDHDTTGPHSFPLVTVSPAWSATPTSSDAGPPTALYVDYPTDLLTAVLTYPLHVVSATGLHGADTSGWDIKGSPDTTLELAPPTPTVTLDALSTSSVRVTISDDNGVDGYRVYRYTLGGSMADATMVKEVAEDADTDPNVYVDSGLAPATGYAYYVTSVRGGVESVPSPLQTVTTFSAPTVAAVMTTQPGRLATTDFGGTYEGADGLTSRQPFRFTAADLGSPTIFLVTYPHGIGATCAATTDPYAGGIDVTVNYGPSATPADVAQAINTTTECSDVVTASIEDAKAPILDGGTYALDSSDTQDITLTIDWGEDVTGLVGASAYLLNGNPAASVSTSGSTTTLTWGTGLPLDGSDTLTIPADAVEVADGTGNAATVLDDTSGAWAVSTP